MKIKATKKPAPKKKLASTQSTTASRRVASPSIKAKNKTPHASTAVLKSIDALCRQIEASQRALALLLKSTRLKIEKALQINKTKLDKLAAQEKKQQATLKTCQTNHKTKPNKLTEAALRKTEQQQRDTANTREQIQMEQTALQTRLTRYQTLANEKRNTKNGTPTAATSMTSNNTQKTSSNKPMVREKETQTASLSLNTSVLNGILID